MVVTTRKKRKQNPETKPAINLCDIIERFGCENRCREYLIELRWPDGVECPECKNKSISWISTRKQYDCNDCRHRFSVKSGTVLHDSHLPLFKWFLVAYMMIESKKGISANQVKRTIGVSYKTAWYLCHRIRSEMGDACNTRLNDTIEADETFIGGKEKNRHLNKRAKKRLGGNWGKETVFSLVERGGRVHSVHTSSVSAATLRPILVSQLDKRTKLITDDAGQYRHMHRDFQHEVVNHSAREYVRGEAHTNTVEGYFSILKRGITGIYHHVSQQHLKRYLGEFDFRYNFRHVSDTERTGEALKGVVGKRLTYRRTNEGVPA